MEDSPGIGVHFKKRRSRAATVSEEGYVARGWGWNGYLKKIEGRNLLGHERRKKEKKWRSSIAYGGYLNFCKNHRCLLVRDLVRHLTVPLEKKGGKWCRKRNAARETPHVAWVSGLLLSPWTSVRDVSTESTHTPSRRMERRTVENYTLARV